MSTTPGGRQTAAGRYEELTTTRSPYLSRARDNAKLSIPALLPPEGSSGSTELAEPYQSMGSQGINNLAAKLLLALFPPNQSFFRISVPDSALAELGATSELRSEIEEGLAKIEREVNAEVEASTIRVTIGEALKHLILAGNYCLQEVPSGGLKGHRLDRYVVKRDPSGNVIEAVIKEQVAPAVLPKDFLAAVRTQASQAARNSATTALDIYTWLRRKDGHFKVHQEVAGKPVPGTEGSYPTERCPFIFLRWTKMDGEDYGRSHVDDCRGDLRSLEGLSGSIVEGAAAAAKVLIFVDPTGITRMVDVAQAPNLAVRSGRAADVTALQVNKAADMSVAMQQAAVLERRLSAAFLMTRSVQRNAERVTAEEIRLLASELEDALGGVYALLGQELQLPYVRVLMARLTRTGRIPELPPSVKPTVVTGLQALGRNHELNRLLTFSRAAQELLGPNALRRINDGEVLRRVATATGIDPSGLIRTDDEVAQADAAAQQQALMEKMGPEVIRARSQQQQPQQQEAPSGP